MYAQCTIAKHGPTKAIQNLKADGDLEGVEDRSNGQLDFDLLYAPRQLHHTSFLLCYFFARKQCKSHL
jgi:hypothetical protein